MIWPVKNISGGSSKFKAPDRALNYSGDGVRMGGFSVFSLSVILALIFFNITSLLLHSLLPCEESIFLSSSLCRCTFWNVRISYRRAAARRGLCPNTFTVPGLGVGNLAESVSGADGSSLNSTSFSPVGKTCPLQNTKTILVIKFALKSVLSSCTYSVLIHSLSTTTCEVPGTIDSGAFTSLDYFVFYYYHYYHI